MGTDIRSILRVGLLTKTCVADTAILESTDISRNQQDYTGDNVRPNQTGVAYYTVQFCPSVDGDLSVVVTDGDDTVEPKVFSGKAGELNIFSFFVRSHTGLSDEPWTFNLKFSVNATIDLLCITEHGGVV